MKHNKLNHNRSIMLGIMAMALVVLTVTIVFWMWCFPRPLSESTEVEAPCVVDLSTDFAGDSLHVYWNDSLLYSGTVDTAGARFGAPGGEALLMVGDVCADLASSFTVEEGVRRVHLKKRDGQVEASFSDR